MNSATTGGQADNTDRTERPSKRKRNLIAPPPVAPPPVEPTPAQPTSAQPITPFTARRAALAEQILLDAFRASWGMRTSDAKEVFGTPEDTAAFAVKAANALWTLLEQAPLEARTP